MKNKVIQTKSDLDATKGTPAYKEFLRLLKGSMTKKECTTVYPDGYDEDLKEGDEGFIPLEFEDVENLEEIQRFGFSKQDFLDLLEDEGV